MEILIDGKDVIAIAVSTEEDKLIEYAAVTGTVCGKPPTSTFVPVSVMLQPLQLGLEPYPVGGKIAILEVFDAAEPE